MGDAFDARKAFVLASLVSSSPDKSPKGGLDAPCAELVGWLNARPDVCTTSSCSGRVSLFTHATGRAKGGTWAYISHERADADALLEAFENALRAQAAALGSGEEGRPGDVVLRFEPFILTAECRTRDAGLQARFCEARSEQTEADPNNAALRRAARLAAGRHRARRRLPRVGRRCRRAASHRDAALLHPARGTPLFSAFSACLLALLHFLTRFSGAGRARRRGAAARGLAGGAGGRRERKVRRKRRASAVALRRAATRSG